MSSSFFDFLRSLVGWGGKTDNRPEEVRWFYDHYKFTLNGNLGFSVANLLVREFNYLATYYSKQQINLENFPAVQRNAFDLFEAIDLDLKSNNPREHECLGIGVEAAHYNLQNLKTCVHAIVDYGDLAEKYGWLKNPILEPALLT
ncbi:hypothetical protein [Variovorax sp. PCZ-1]|uniref:hypothetical protein n=1 Tax=Variovorax sp. PCZ-1 TaxID=2835533 RepID=UPI001BCEF31F|nr:hypothetical protein [Variovorax sp. PCZ-1]MBS7806139.1 hypothetical protein [Variovorax sp. PCZ-1]